MQVMIVLPLKEGFSPQGIGAIGLLVKRLAQKNDLIVGRFLNDSPFLKDQYHSIKKTWLSFFNKNRDYSKGVIKSVKYYTPEIIEVHNDPKLVHDLIKYFPKLKISLILHNDPINLKGLKSFTQRQTIIRYAHIIAVSPWIKERFLLGGIQGEVKVIPNSIDINEIPPYRDIAMRQKTILFVGRVVSDKGADIFIKIGKKLLEFDDEWSIELVGADRFNFSNQQTPFIRQIKQLAKNTNIKFHGYLAYPQVLEKIAQANIVILPSRWAEPFGMTALETMACGTPLIVSATGALPWVVGNGAIVVSSQDETLYFEELLSLIHDKKKQEILSIHALRRASQFTHIDIQKVIMDDRQQLYYSS